MGIVTYFIILFNPFGKNVESYFRDYLGTHPEIAREYKQL